MCEAQGCWLRFVRLSIAGCSQSIVIASWFLEFEVVEPQVLVDGIVLERSSNLPHVWAEVFPLEQVVMTEWSARVLALHEGGLLAPMFLASRL